VNNYTAAQKTNYMYHRRLSMVIIPTYDNTDKTYLGQTDHSCKPIGTLSMFYGHDVIISKIRRNLTEKKQSRTTDEDSPS